MNSSARTPRRWMVRRLVAIVFAALPVIGCGTGPSGDGNGPPPGENSPPMADAGESQVVAAGADVTLDGSKSSDADGDELTFTWTQTVGGPVMLSSTTEPIVSFTAPDSGAALTFELTVSDGQSQSQAQTIVSVLPEDSSAQIEERVERSVTEDPAAMGEFPDDWLIDVGNDLPQQDPEDAELSEFDEAFQHTQMTGVEREDLAPGETREVSLEIQGASGLAGLAQWIGTIDPLEVSISLDGAGLADAGDTYTMGADRGGTYLQALTTTGGHVTMSVTNTMNTTVTIRMTFGATSPEGE